MKNISNIESEVKIANKKVSLETLNLQMGFC